LHTESFGAFIFGKAAPDPIWLADFQCVGETFVDDGAAAADGLGLVNAGFP
jgi:hypothetical protein